MAGGDREPDRPGGRFATTHWSLVAAAADSQNPESREALSELCEMYWYPVYAQVRHAGCRPETAEDLTQGFFVQLLEKRSLEVASPDRGMFRAFLKTALRNYMANERHRARAAKRGGGRTILSLDFKDAESRYEREAVVHQTPEHLFEKRWARTLLSRALGRLRESAQDTESKKRLRCLEPLLTGRTSATRYRDLAGELGMTEGALKVAVHRLRHRFGETLRAEVASTVEHPDQVDDELRFLFSVIDS